MLIPMLTRIAKLPFKIISVGINICASMLCIFMDFQCCDICIDFEFYILRLKPESCLTE